MKRRISHAEAMRSTWTPLRVTQVRPASSARRWRPAAVVAGAAARPAETPRLFFMHFWGVGSPEKIAGALEAALTRVDVKP